MERKRKIQWEPWVMPLVSVVSGACPAGAALCFGLACGHVFGCAVTAHSWFLGGAIGLAPVPAHRRWLLAHGSDVDGGGERGDGVREPGSAGGLSGGPHRQGPQSTPDSNGFALPLAGDGAGTRGAPGSVPRLSPPPAYSRAAAHPPSLPAFAWASAARRGERCSPLSSGAAACPVSLGQSPLSPGHGPAVAMAHSGHGVLASRRAGAAGGRRGGRSCHPLLLAHPHRDADPVPGPRCPPLTVCHHPAPKPGQGWVLLAPGQANHGRATPRGSRAGHCRRLGRGSAAPGAGVLLNRML